jgi:RHS repeat-associated protein
VTVTLAYTYTADGLRVAQSVNGNVTTFVWDVALLLAQVLATSDETMNIYGLERIGEVQGNMWIYPLGDSLGSVRQWVDSGGVVTYAAGYTPFGEELWHVGSTTSAWGYTGEWQDPNVGMVYLRARWYASGTGRFTQRDPWLGTPVDPLTLNPYIYALANPVNFSDPSGYQSESEEVYIRQLYNQHLEDIADRLNVHSLTNLSNDAFATMIAARILVEDATAFADRQPRGNLSELLIALVGLRPWARDLLADAVFGDEISWGPANMRLDFVMSNLEWWETAYLDLGLNFEDVHTYYYDARDRGWFLQWLIGNEENMLELELMLDEGTANQMALAILQSSWRARQYRQRKYLESGGCEQIPELSAYIIAMGIRFYGETDETLYTVSGWTSRGMPWDWVEAMDDTANALDLHITRYVDYVPYTDEEKEKLLTLPQ